MKKKKIPVLLTIDEISAIVSMLSGEEEKVHRSLLVDSFEIPLKTRLLKTLKKDERTEFIRLEVVKVLSRSTGIPVGEIDDDDNLIEDLGMTSIQIRALGVPFTNIARKFNPKAVVTPDQCEECETVGDCVSLVVEQSKP